MRVYNRYLLGALLLGSSAWGDNFALVAVGDSFGHSREAPSHHDFGRETLQTTEGLSRLGWKTTLLYTPQAGQVTFQESAAVERLKEGGVTVTPSNAVSLGQQITRLSAQVGAGDKVFLSIMAHGNGQDGNFSFSLGGADPVSAEELARLLLPLKQTGAQVAVALNSCYSGNFPSALLEQLRGADGGPGACVMVSSAKGQMSEACMESDFGADGQYVSPENRSHTSAIDFLTTYIAQKAGLTGNPNGGRCDPLARSHYQSCVGQQAAPANLDEVFRMGRRCDQTTNLGDHLGVGTAFEGQMAELGEAAMRFTYDRVHNAPPLVQYPVHQVMRGPEAGKAERAIAAVDQILSQDATGYSAHVKKAVELLLQQYRQNLFEQQSLIRALSENPPEFTVDRTQLRQALGEMGTELEALWKRNHEVMLQIQAQKGKPVDPNLQPDTLDTVGMMDLISELQWLLRGPFSTAQKEQMLRGLELLVGNTDLPAKVRELSDLQTQQQGLYRQILEAERQAYESYSATQGNNPCKEFSL